MPWRPFLAALALIAAPGCAFVQTAEDCADLAATVNPTLQGVELDAGPNDPPETVHALADMYASLSAELVAKRYDSPELAPLVGQYATLTKEVADNAEAYARALKDGQLKAKEKAARASMQHTARQRALNRRIQTVCAGH